MEVARVEQAAEGGGAVGVSKTGKGHEVQKKGIISRLP